MYRYTLTEKFMTLINLYNLKLLQNYYTFNIFFAFQNKATLLFRHVCVTQKKIKLNKAIYY